MADKTFEYDEIHMTMERANVSVDISELHGGMCGLLCLGDSTAVASWIDECLGKASNMDDELDAARTQLLELKIKSLGVLTGADLDFYRLLPDDN